MSIEIWISFIFASLILFFSPGPTIFLIMGQSLNHGKKSVVPLVTGVFSGDLVAMSLSFAGLGVLLATSAMLFNIFKWVAAAYLFYLGIKAWRTKSNPEKCIEKRYQEIVLSSKLYAVPFYQACGFKKMTSLTHLFD